MNEPTTFPVAGRSTALIIRTARFLLLAVLLSVWPFSASSQTLVTFDDIHSYSQGVEVPSAYQGLSWSNFWVLNSTLFSNGLGATGYCFGMVSPSNVVFNGLGNPAEIDSPGTNFNFLSAYLTGAWNSNLSIEVEGFNAAQEIYDTIVVAGATNATLFTFDYFNIDRLYFDSYGGESAGFGQGAGENFVMDNFTFEFVPEPSTILLTVLGAVPLCAFLRRRRA
jgi:hypothetical protein